ncbi:MAG TPA: J domain-containing protein [Ktedonobacterales bacterium]|nr:J domain-containing protein [Ktedonobacterales bacterium]
MQPHPSDDLDYYAILGVTPDASTVEVKQAYRALVKRFHPDLYALNPDIAWEAEIRMSEINRANEVLSDSQKRQQYDEQCLMRAAQWSTRGNRPTARPPEEADDDLAAGISFRALAQHAFKSARQWLAGHHAASTQSRFLGIPSKIILTPIPFCTAIVVSSMLWQLGTATGFQVPGVISAVLAYPVIVVSLVVRLMLPIRYSPMISPRKKLALTPLILASALLVGWLWLMVVDQHGTVGNMLDIYWWCGLITMTSLTLAFL